MKKILFVINTMGRAGAEVALLFCLGIIGQYIAKTYMETKQRPHYIIAKTNMEGAIKIR